MNTPSGPPIPPTVPKKPPMPMAPVSQLGSQKSVPEKKGSPLPAPKNTVKKTVPIKASQENSSKAATSDSFVFNTMKDDLSAASERKGSISTLPPQSQQVQPTDKAKANPLKQFSAPGQSLLKTQQKSVKKNPPPAKQGASVGKVSRTVSPPAPTRIKKSSRTILYTLIFTIIMIAGGAGAAWYWGLWDSLMPGDGQQKENVNILSAGEILSSQASLFVQYSFTSTETRSSAISAWASDTAETFNGAISGDPRLFAKTAGISEVYYVILPDSTQPFFLTPATQEAKKLFESQDSAYVENGGWIIAHSIDPSAYLESLSNSGSLESAGTIAVSSENKEPIRLYVGPRVVSQLLESAVGPAFKESRIMAMQLAGRYSSEGALELSGEAQMMVQPSTDYADQQQLVSIPGGANFIHLGSNFSEDALVWSEKTDANVNEMLNQPAVKALISTFSTPYTLYTDNSAQGNRSFGLIVEMPPQSDLTMGDTALEQAVMAFVPLLTGIKPATSLSFSDGIYQEMPLRFVNISGSPYALDYSIQNGYLIIATSKDGAFNLLDTFSGSASITASDEELIQSLMNELGAIPVSKSLTIGSFSHPVINSLINPGKSGIKANFIMSFDSSAQADKSMSLSGVIKSDTTDLPAETQPEL